MLYHATHLIFFIIDGKWSLQLISVLITIYQRNNSGYRDQYFLFFKKRTSDLFYSMHVCYMHRWSTIRIFSSTLWSLELCTLIFFHNKKWSPQLPTIHLIFLQWNMVPTISSSSHTNFHSRLAPITALTFKSFFSMVFL